MKNAVRLAAILLSLVFGAIAVPGPARAQVRRYVCDPCGLPCDEIVCDHPGTCPKCGMPLVDQEAADHARESASRAQKRVAILIFDGVEIIDYTGPWEVFGAAGFDVYTVAGTKEPVTTAMGMTVLPKYTFADAPQPDVLVIPGGGVTAARDGAATLRWVTDANTRTVHTMSVCNGAFILASAGLLDGLTATTTSGNIARLKAEYPKTNVVDDQRFVDNGRIITTAGLSAGIDGALHVVSRMLGQGIAQKDRRRGDGPYRPQSHDQGEMDAHHGRGHTLLVHANESVEVDRPRRQALDRGADDPGQPRRRPPVHGEADDRARRLGIDSGALLASNPENRRALTSNRIGP